MEIADLLDSDQRILGHSKRTVENGQTLITFDWGDGSPPLRGVLPAELNAAILVEWCTAVRRAYNARENSKATAVASKAADVRGPHDGEASDAGVASGGGLPVEADNEDPQAALAAWIESSLASLDRRIERTRAEIAEIRRSLDLKEQSLEALEERVVYFMTLKEATNVRPKV